MNVLKHYEVIEGLMGRTSKEAGVWLVKGNYWSFIGEMRPSLMRLSMIYRGLLTTAGD
jgi:hypothetical protein